MAKIHKGKGAPAPSPQVTSQGEHGGNRSGDHEEQKAQPKRSSQAEGKDPKRGEPMR